MNKQDICYPTLCDIIEICPQLFMKWISVTSLGQRLWSYKAIQYIHAMTYTYQHVTVMTGIYYLS